MSWDDIFGFNDPDPDPNPIVPPEPFENGYPDPPPPGPTPDPNPGNPFTPPGEGNGPGGTPGPGGDAPGSGGDQFDWGAFSKDPMAYLKSLLPALQSGALPASIASILKSVLPLITSGLGTLNLNNKTDDAVKQLQAGADKSNQFAIDTIGGAQKNFQPYIDTGAKSVGDLYGMVGNNNLAGNFSKYAAAPSSSMPQITGAMTLADLAKLRK